MNDANRPGSLKKWLLVAGGILVLLTLLGVFDRDPSAAGAYGAYGNGGYGAGYGQPGDGYHHGDATGASSNRDGGFGYVSFDDGTSVSYGG